MEEAAMRGRHRARPAPAPAVQEQRRRQGRQLRHPRELPDGPRTPFTAVIAGLTPFFVSRQVVCGSGRVGIGPPGRRPDSSCRSASDYIEVEVGLETTLKRGIINTRDEPHADADKYRRLHVIIGDANLAETSTYPQGRHHRAGAGHDRGRGPVRRPAAADPVRAVHTISRDPELKATVDLANGRKFTGLDLQGCLPSSGHRARRDRHGGSRTDIDPVAAETCCGTWGDVLDALARDPMECADRLDWPAKLRLLEGYRARDGLNWSVAAAAPGRPAVLRRAAGQGPVQPAGGPRLDEAAGQRGGGAGGDHRRRRRTPEPTSAGAAWSATRRRSRRRPGTR